MGAATHTHTDSTGTGIILSHPTGSPFAANAARAFSDAGKLRRLYTCFSYNPAGRFAALLSRLPPGIRARAVHELERRAWTPGGANAVTQFPSREAVRMLLAKSGIAALTPWSYQQQVDWVYRGFDRAVAKSIGARREAHTVYCYEDAAAESFAVARDFGGQRIYDLPIMHYRRVRTILEEEARRYPEFAASIAALHESPQKTARKDREIELASRVVTASSVTKRSLLEIGFPESRIAVIPYGVSQDFFGEEPAHDKPFRALFVGRIGPRKGVHYLLEAWEALGFPRHELHLAGILEFPRRWWARHAGRVTAHDSLPHRQLPQVYRQATVLVFPSLVEGFGMVLLEAMAAGLPVITTAHTAGPDLIDDGIEGFIVPPGDAAALRDRLAWCRDNVDRTREMGLAARKKAAQYTWERYRTALVSQFERWQSEDA